MAENPIITGFKENKLIDDKILFFTGVQKLQKEAALSIGIAAGYSTFQRMHAIGLCEGVLRCFRISTSFQLKELIFELKPEEIKAFELTKGFLGKLTLVIATKTWVLKYKVNANKVLAYKIREQLLELGACNEENFKEDDLEDGNTNTERENND